MGQSKTVIRHSFAQGLSMVTGIPVPERIPEPTITTPAAESNFRARVEMLDLNAFREEVRKELSRNPSMRDEVILLASRFGEHSGYAKLLAILQGVKEALDAPEFDFSNPVRLKSWVNGFFNRKTVVSQ